jgi:hypothetical protein
VVGVRRCWDVPRCATTARRRYVAQRSSCVACVCTSRFVLTRWPRRSPGTASGRSDRDGQRDPRVQVPVRSLSLSLCVCVCVCVCVLWDCSGGSRLTTHDTRHRVNEWATKSAAYCFQITHPERPTTYLASATLTERVTARTHLPLQLERARLIVFSLPLSACACACACCV